MTRSFWELAGVADREVVSGLRELIGLGCRTEARILAHLAEVETRRLHLKAGYSSLFDYCLRQLGLSENEAGRRITGARLGRRFPVIFELLEQRKIHLTGVCLLRDHLCEENYVLLLGEACGKTRREIEALIATRFPRPNAASFVRKLPDRVGRRAPARELELEGKCAPGRERELAGGLRGGGRAAQRVEQLSAARYRIQLDASTELKAKLELARDLMSHANPRGELALVVERGLDLLIEHLQKARFGKTDRPRARRASTVGAPDAVTEGRRRGGEAREHLRHATRREVLARDGLGCSYVAADGKHCAARAFLQIHHEQPWARGGSSEASNLRVLCAAHNRLLAERDFGREHVQQRVEEKRARQCGGAADRAEGEAQRSSGREETPCPGKVREPSGPVRRCDALPSQRERATRTS